MSRGQQQAPAKVSPEPTAEEFAAAREYEAEVAEQASEIRGESAELTPELFMKLYPLLTKPIPAAYIKTIGTTTGKPYESTGIRSVQVQIDRMNSVLTPLWWWDHVEYEQDGKLATVTIYVGDQSAPGNTEPLIRRSSRGGVGQGSGAGNIYKGSYTNAAKLAFARLGPGHEVYLGAADLDPDVNQEVADQSPGGNGPPAKSAAQIGPKVAGQLVDRAWKIDTARTNLQLAASHIVGKDVGDCDTEEGAVEGLAGLSFEQAEQLSRWIERKQTEAEAEAAGEGVDHE